jgi:iron complex transport system ATP-binding protein
MARHVAVVSQGGEAQVPISVRELVSMGRHPYLGVWSALSREDHTTVDACLESVDLIELSACDVRELSGGELQRARLARALVQEPRVLLLDEPTAHLDLGHEARFMELVRQYTVTQAVTVVAVTHHLNVSSRFADRMVLLSEGSVLMQGPPDLVLTPELLETAFHWPVEVVDLGELGRHAIAGTRDPGNGVQ